MNEFYWITRLDSICGLLAAFAVIAVIAFVIGLIGFVINFGECYDSDERKARNYFKKMTIISCIVFFFASTINAFIPSTKDAYIIYGIGGYI